MTKPLKLAFIGYGEVGKLFARQFREKGVAGMTAYDLLFDDPSRGAEKRAEAQQANVSAGASAADAARDADVVFSCVTADQAEPVARLARSYLRPGQFFVDVNSAAPETKRRAAAEVMAAGAHYIEAAVMAPVAPKGIATAILAGGPEAGRAAALLNPLGMDVAPVSSEYGRASATKLSRSIMIKGIEALIVDAARSARAWGVADDVFASLERTFPGTDFAALADNMAERVRTHGLRRAAEMREAADMLDDLGVNSSLARAVADAQERGAAVNADKAKSTR
ncbi:MAG: NAD(P)-dependent oxidoreductase [Rhodoblastus sp.]|nr:NAD(P)-dependent oxidoreductase [Rhodoblastus sp.]